VQIYDICIHIHIYNYIHVYVYEYIYMCIYTYIYVYMYIYILICIHVQIDVYIYIHIHVRIYIYLCIYICCINAYKTYQVETALEASQKDNSVLRDRLRDDAHTRDEDQISATKVCSGLSGWDGRMEGGRMGGWVGG